VRDFDERTINFSSSVQSEQKFLIRLFPKNIFYSTS
jgi:hypothetical protein